MIEESWPPSPLVKVKHIHSTHSNIHKCIIGDLHAELISSPSFDPKKFLLQCHKSTSFAELKRGLQNLDCSIQTRTETLKGLVKDNFDRFVGAKSTVDAIYKELKTKNLQSAGYGTDNFSLAIGETFEQANQVIVYYYYE